jgi:hypothetical protein
MKALEFDTGLRRRLGGWFQHIAEDTLPARLAVWQLRNSIQDEL